MNQSEQCQQIVNNYLELGANFQKPPEAKLVLISQTIDPAKPVSPQDIVISATIQCRSPGRARMIPRGSEQQHLAQDTLDQGHFTTRMHLSTTFLLDCTRSLVHEVFHSQPYHNSEQQSQRTVPATIDHVLIPDNITATQKDFFLHAIEDNFTTYTHLSKMLKPVAEKLYRLRVGQSRFSATERTGQLPKVTNEIAIEAARYALPIGQRTTLFHTVNHITLLRLFRESQQDYVTDEGRHLIGQMITEVIKKYPNFIDDLRLPTGRQKVDYHPAEIHHQKENFDQSLAGHYSKLTSITPHASEILHHAATQARGQEISTLDLLNPALNPYLTDLYNDGMHDPVTKSLRTVTLGFNSIYSHSGHSQEQRHRGVSNTHPPIAGTYDGQPDYQIPLIIQNDPLTLEYYQNAMTTLYANVQHALELGITPEIAYLLLPNATSIRVSEQTDLLDFLNLDVQRVCNLAQNEIARSTIDKAIQVHQYLPESRQLFQAPCVIRKNASLSPRCPYGTRYCGQPVYNWTITEFQERRLY